MAESTTKTFYIRVENNQVTDINRDNIFSNVEKVAGGREIKSKVIDGFVNGLFGLKNESCGSKCGEGPLDEDEDDIYDHDSDIFDSDDENISELIAEGIKDHFSKNDPIVFVEPAKGRVLEDAALNAALTDVPVKVVPGTIQPVLTAPVVSATQGPAVSDAISKEIKDTFDKNPVKNQIIKSQLSDLIKTELENIFGKNRSVGDIIETKVTEKFSTQP
jgi:hypothetical protein